MPDPQTLTVSEPDGTTIPIAFRHDGRPDKADGPTGLFWLGGFMSDMDGSKASLLAKLAIAENRANTRFDYSGHGASGGEFTKGTISAWLEQAIAVFEQQTCGPRVIVGSSMGGWLALLLYRHFARTAPEIAERIKGLVLIAPAGDMTKDLMWDKYDEKTRQEITDKGFHAEPSDYGDEPYIITQALIEDGQKHLLLDDGLDVDCPVRILQGDKDPDVPWQHGMRVYEAIGGADVALTLIKSGDHRLSTPANLEMLKQTCRSLFALAEG